MSDGELTRIERGGGFSDTNVSVWVKQTGVGRGVDKEDRVRTVTQVPFDVLLLKNRLLP